MRLSILYILLMVAAHVLFVLLHIKVFQSNWPFAVWVSIALHTAFTLFFPYTKLLRAK